MSEILKCEIVRDLLPSYVDGLTADVTNLELEKHMKECKECASLLDKMREPAKNNQYPEKELDYLKKVGQRARMKTLLGILGTVILIAGFFVWRVFIFGFRTSPAFVDYKASLSGDTVTLSGSLMGSGESFSHVQFSEKNGRVTAEVYTVPVSAFGNLDSFSVAYKAKESVSTVYFDNIAAYDNGSISRAAAEAFNTKTPYVGNISADVKVADTLGVRTKIGDYTNELQTSFVPYGWTLRLKSIVPAAEEKSIYEKMTDYSAALISLIDNLGSVTWEFETESGTKTLIVTENDASILIGKNIKDCSSSVGELQKLMESLGLI